MASTINASTSSGLVSTADTSGVLQLQTADTTAVSIDASQAVTFSAGTANGVSYLNGSKVLTTGSALTFDSSDRLIVGAGSAAIGSRMEVTTTSAGQSIGIRGRASDAIGILSWHANASATEYARILSDNTSVLIFGTGSSGTERMRLDASGNLGVGTSSPICRVDAREANRTNSTNITNVGIYTTNNPTIDYGGTIAFGGRFDSGSSSPAPFGSIRGAKENSIDTNYNGYLAFQTIKNSDVLTERMRLDSSGNLLVGTTSGSFSQVVGTGSYVFGLYQTTANGNVLNIDGNYSSGTQNLIVFSTSGAYRGAVTYNGTSVQYTTASDYRLKENVRPMQNALAKVAALKPVTYTLKENGGAGEGFIAHELQAIVPDCVTGEKDAVDADGNPQYQGIDTSFLVATLTAAIQEQQALIQSLTDRIAQLENKL
jgi:hypothetical protein